MHQEIGTFIEFPNLKMWCVQNPHIICNLVKYFEHYIDTLSLLNKHLSSTLVKIVLEYMEETNLNDVFYYFAQAQNRDFGEFKNNLKQLASILQLHLTYNDDVRKLHVLLTECDEDWVYVQLDDMISDRNIRCWQRWLKKMDFVFRNIVWIY